MSAQVYSLLGKIEGAGKFFFEGYKTGSPHCEITPRALGCHKR